LFLAKKNDVISKTYLHFAPIVAHEQRQKHELVSALVLISIYQAFELFLWIELS
jgi:hypothetical protein